MGDQSLIPDREQENVFLDIEARLALRFFNWKNSGRAVKLTSQPPLSTSDILAFIYFRNFYWHSFPLR
jgi:hypothetical protein